MFRNTPNNRLRTHNKDTSLPYHSIMRDCASHIVFLASGLIDKAMLTGAVPIEQTGIDGWDLQRAVAEQLQNRTHRCCAS